MSEERKTRLRRGLRVLLLVTLCVIWGNSMLPGKESGELSGWLFTALNGVGIRITERFLRKAAHFGEFGLLGVELTLLFWIRSGLSFQSLCNAAFAALLAAMTDETIQSFVVNRSSELADVRLDFAGALTGILFTALLLRLMEKERPLSS